MVSSQRERCLQKRHNDSLLNQPLDCRDSLSEANIKEDRFPKISTPHHSKASPPYLSSRQLLLSHLKAINLLQLSATWYVVAAAALILFLVQPLFSSLTYPSISPSIPQIFLSFFKTLIGKEVAVELKNDVVLTGQLHSVDQYLNIKLLNVAVVQPEKYPQLTSLKSCFVRGSVVRYIQIPPELVDTELLQDAARKENAPRKTNN